MTKKGQREREVAARRSAGRFLVACALGERITYLSCKPIVAGGPEYIEPLAPYLGAPLVLRNIEDSRYRTSFCRCATIEFAAARSAAMFIGGAVPPNDPCEARALDFLRELGVTEAGELAQSLRILADTFLELNWDRVERLAAELQRKGRLSGAAAAANVDKPRMLPLSDSPPLRGLR